MLTVGKKFDEKVEEIVGRKKELHLKGYELVYILESIEQNMRIEEKYDLDVLENKDMKEIYDMNEEAIKDSLLGAIDYENRCTINSNSNKH